MMWLIFAPLLCGIFFGLIQLSAYSLLKRAGRIDEIPFFGILVFRGMIITIALAVFAAIILHYTDLGVAI